MWTIFFIITTIVCAIGWLACHIGAKAIVYYMKQKGYPRPDEKEINECTRHVVEMLFKK